MYNEFLTPVSVRNPLSFQLEFELQKFELQKQNRYLCNMGKLRSFLS